MAKTPPPKSVVLTTPTSCLMGLSVAAASIGLLALGTACQRTDAPAAARQGEDQNPRTGSVVHTPTEQQQSSFRSDLFQPCIRAAAAFRRTKDTADALLTELNVLRLQSLSKEEQAVVVLLGQVAQQNIKLVVIDEIRQVSDGVLAALPETVAAFAGQPIMGDWSKRFQQEVIAMSQQGKGIVFINRGMFDKWNADMAAKLAVAEIQPVATDSGNKYAALKEAEEKSSAISEAVLRTAATLINSGGKMPPKRN